MKVEVKEGRTRSLEGYITIKIWVKEEFEQ